MSYFLKISRWFLNDSIVEAEVAAAAALVASKRLKGKSYRQAAEVLEHNQDDKKPSKSAKKAVQQALPSNTDSKVRRTAIPTPSGLVPEVVIRVASKSSTPDGAESEDNTRKRKRRASTKRLVISSDDEDTDPKRSGRNTDVNSAKRQKTTKRKSSPSDYGDSSAEDKDHESDFALASDFSDEEVEPMTRKKTKAIPKVKMASANKKSQVEESEATDMDVDSLAIKGKKKQAKKVVNNEEQPKKKAKRADNDPWKLSSRAVQNEWTYMQAPPFEMFHFARVVVDEYTYLDGKVHALVTNLTADRQWVLSGTPPIHDFGALKTIAAFLNIHLGIDDDSEGRSAEVKKRTREQTGENHNHYFLIALVTFFFSC